MPKPVRTLTVLNDHGDETIIWDESSDATMVKIIKKKMAAGIVFFVIEPRFYGLLPSRKTQLGKATDATKHRALMLSDEDFSKFVSDGHGDVIKTPTDAIGKPALERSAETVAKSRSVATKPLAGG